MDNVRTAVALAERKITVPCIWTEFPRIFSSSDLQRIRSGQTCLIMVAFQEENHYKYRQITPASCASDALHVTVNLALCW